MTDSHSGDDGTWNMLVPAVVITALLSVAFYATNCSGNLQSEIEDLDRDIANMRLQLDLQENQGVGAQRYIQIQISKLRAKRKSLADDLYEKIDD